MTLLEITTTEAAVCDCDAPLRATPADPRPFHRASCAAMTCPCCGQARIAHPFDDDELFCPDGRGAD